jgi:hypothetical protein
MPQNWENRSKIADVAAALSNMTDIPRVQDFMADVDKSMHQHEFLGNQSWSSVLADPCDTSGLLDLEVLRKEEETLTSHDGKTSSLRLLSYLGRLYENSHLLYPQTFSSLNAVCERLLCQFGWLEPTLRKSATVHMLVQLPALAGVFEETTHGSAQATKIWTEPEVEHRSQR